MSAVRIMRCVSCSVVMGEAHKPECLALPKPRSWILATGIGWSVRLQQRAKDCVYAVYTWSGSKASSVLESNELATEQAACAELLENMKKERHLAQAQLDALDDAIGRLSEES